MAVPLRVLVVEDSEDDAALVVRELRRGGYEPVVTRVDTADAMNAALDHQTWDVILADYMMPQFSAPAALKLVQDRGLDVPFIVVSGTIGEGTAVEAMKAGAHDYFPKHNLTRLVAALQRELREAEVRAARRRAEDRIRLLSQALEQSPTIVVMTDTNERIEYVNQAFTKVTGYAPEEVIGTNATKLGEELPQDEYARLLSTITSGGTWLGEFHSYRKDGGRYWELATISSIKNADGAITHFIKVAEDITERKQMEEALREADRRAINEYQQLLERLTVLEQRMGTARDLVTVFRALRDFAVTSVPFGGIFVSLYDPATQLRTCIYSAGPDEEDDVSTLPPMPLNNSPHARAVATGEVIVTDDLQKVYADAGVAPVNVGLERDPRLPQSSIAVPLAVMGRIIGGFEVQSVQLAAFTKEHVVAMKMAASVAAIATENVQSLERERSLRGLAERRVEHLAALRNIDLAITSTLDLRVTLGVLLDCVTERLRVDAAAVLLLNQHTQMLEFAAGRGFRTRAISDSRLRLGEGLAGHAALERRIIGIPDLKAAGETSGRASLLPGEDFVAHFSAPLIAKGRVSGVLEIFHRRRLDPDQEWQGFLEALAIQAAIAIDNAGLFDGMQRANAGLLLAYDTTLEGWSRALDLRDKETEGHTQRVTELAVGLARAMGMGEEDLVHVRRGALLHDIGKMGIPDSVLLKPGPLTEHEWEIMRKHPVYAYELLSPIPYLRPALDIPYCHHEKWDGTGYPRGLKEEQIPLAARIFAVVDVWDALQSDRPYRPAWAKERTLDHIREQSGKHFDPNVVEAFLKMHHGVETPQVSP
jgi:PAS domain S-box-containing protein/putative nucleotidyltransferase with HDIG domain